MISTSSTICVCELYQVISIWTSTNLELNLEQLSNDCKCLSLIWEWLDISRDVLTLPFIIPEKGPCKLLAAFLVTEPGNFLCRRWLHLAFFFDGGSLHIKSFLIIITLYFKRVLAWNFAFTALRVNKLNEAVMLMTSIRELPGLLFKWDTPVWHIFPVLTPLIPCILAELFICNTNKCTFDTKNLVLYCCCLFWHHICYLQGASHQYLILTKI